MAAGPAPAIDGAKEKSSAFPPAWVKTPQDFDDWLYDEVKRTLENPGPRLSAEEVWARMDRHIAELKQARAQRDVAGAF